MAPIRERRARRVQNPYGQSLAASSTKLIECATYWNSGFHPGIDLSGYLGLESASTA